MKQALGSILMGLTAWTAWGQPAAARPEFDVASLKAVTLDGADLYTANLGMWRNGSLTLTNTTLAESLRFAYRITTDDLVAGPDWIKNKSVRFDILAKAPPGTSDDDARLMLRTLLEDRFKMVFHHEPREYSYYALVAGKGGPKLDVAQEPPAAGGVSHGLGRIHNNHISMLFLATLIARFTRTPVLDMTGLPGFYDVKLDWSRDNGLPAAAAPSSDPTTPAAPMDTASGPSIFDAVQKQLGLKLEKRKGPVDVLVIDHAEKTPLGN